MEFKTLFVTMTFLISGNCQPYQQEGKDNNWFLVLAKTYTDCNNIVVKFIEHVYLMYKQKYTINTTRYPCYVLIESFSISLETRPLCFPKVAHETIFLRRYVRGSYK